MQQLSLKLNMYVKSISVVNNIEKFVLHIIFWSFGILALIYVCLLGNMVKNIVERQAFEVEARALSNEVRNLEVTYLSLSSGVDLSLANSMGFQKIQENFATRKSFSFLSPFYGGINTVQNDI